MASDLFHQQFNMDHFNFKRCGNQSFGEPNHSARPKSNIFVRHRPNFLRLDSAGDSCDSSPESHMGNSYGTGSLNNNTVNQTLCSQPWDTTKRRHRFQRESAPKARRTTKSCQYLQSNKSIHSKETLSSGELEHLASKFNSCSASEQVTMNNIPISECNRQMMSQFHSFQGRAQGGRGPCHPLNITSPPSSGIPQPNPQEAANHQILNMPMPFALFRPNFFHNQPQRWIQQAPFRPPINQLPWGFHGNHFPQMPHGPAHPPRFAFPHQGLPLTHFANYSQQFPKYVKDFKQPYRNNGRKKCPNREKKEPEIFTKILQRPSQAQEENDCKRSNDATTTSGVEGSAMSKTENKLTEINEISKSTQNGGKINVGVQSMCPSVNIQDTSRTASRQDGTVVDGDSSLNNLARTNHKSSKQRHSSIDFLLCGIKSSDRMSDSDFVDCDWDTLDACDADESDKTWDEYFISNDPYNPLTGWRCPKIPSPMDDQQNEATAHWSHRSQEFDSGTESGSEGETDSESEGEWDDDNEELPCGAAKDCKVSLMEDVNESDNFPIKAEESFQERRVKQNEEIERRQKCLHPSISYVLGGFGGHGNGNDESDDDSDDWDSFDDSDDDYLDELTTPCKPDHLNLFQFSNDRFTPLSNLRGGPLCGPELKSSPSAPCGPIFKPKARTVLISQRIICQVSDQPVSMVVPLEKSGKMSQNLMPAIQVSCLPSTCRGQSFPTSCLKLLSRPDAKTSKKVHFNNKAILIVCPEPSHLVDDIRSTRKGPWLDYARDRCRFQHRIQHLERVIGPCLSVEHRKKVTGRIYKQEGAAAN